MKKDEMQYLMFEELKDIRKEMADMERRLNDKRDKRSFDINSLIIKVCFGIMAAMAGTITYLLKEGKPWE